MLAWRLIHVSRVTNRYLLTEMDFHAIKGHQADNPNPVKVSLREVDEHTAKGLLADVKRRSPAAWNLMFGASIPDSSWTVAGLTDFRELYNRLSAGTLRWVLSTGMPLHSEFRIYLGDDQITSSKARRAPLKSIDIDDNLEGIGNVTGVARIYEKPLTGGKSADVGRSHGFFIRVRERVINVEDELFGITQPNHAAWTRFALEVRAEGLRDHLLSSREGVRDSQDVRTFRRYLVKVFNQCRSTYDEWSRTQSENLDIQALLSDAPSNQILDPLLRAVRTALESGESSFYIDAPKNGTDLKESAWLEGFRTEIAEKPFEGPSFVKQGPRATAVRYNPTTRDLAINLDHPFVNKLTGDDKNRNPAKVFALAEVLLEGLLQEQGLNHAAVGELLQSRDRTLRLAVGETQPSVGEALRLLSVANQNAHALERATGAAFRVLGFEYEQKGGNRPGADGVLRARLGRHTSDKRGDFALVYDAKHTRKPSVPADKIDPSGLENYRVEESAQYGFFIAARYASEAESAGRINSKMFPEDRVGAFNRLTLLKVDHLNHLVRLHVSHGLTLSEIRSMFKNCRTVDEVGVWISDKRREMAGKDVPIALLLDALEELKDDERAVPSIYAARMISDELKEFEPEKLIARMKALKDLIGERWLNVDESGTVKMHQTAEQIKGELARQIRNLDGDENR